MLEALDRGNLFVVALDDRRQWYRYHPDSATRASMTGCTGRVVACTVVACRTVNA